MFIGFIGGSLFGCVVMAYLIWVDGHNKRIAKEIEDYVHHRRRQPIP